MECVRKQSCKAPWRRWYLILEQLLEGGDAWSDWGVVGELFYKDIRVQNTLRKQVG